MVTVPAPIQWGTGTGHLPNGTKVCLLQLSQGQLTASVQLLPHDMRRLAADLLKTADQSESSLIIPSAVAAPGLNGNH
jgi:hypothetical protein